MEVGVLTGTNEYFDEFIEEGLYSLFFAAAHHFC